MQTWNEIKAMSINLNLVLNSQNLNKISGFQYIHRKANKKRRMFEKPAMV